MSTERPTVKTISAVCIGNALEWYDFMIYNFMLLFIAQAYFPSDNRISSLLATMASSGVALLVRPLGGILLGIWADRHGHSKALMLVFNLMAFATLLIVFCPSYAQIGVWASILVVGARLIQGLATGGEFGIASTLLVTLSPRNKTGLYTSLQMMGQLLALLAGLLICFMLTLYCSQEALYEYAWRLPFVAGLIILPVGWILRIQLRDKINWSSTKSTAIYPLLKQQKGALVIAWGLIVGCTASFYTLFSYMPTFSMVYLHFSLTESYLGPMAGIIVSLISIPFFGALSDRIGKKPILLAALTMYLLLVYPLLSMLQHQPDLRTLLEVEAILGVFIGAYFGVLTAVVGDLFPASIRSTCMAISYNMAVMIFGGFAPLIITTLVERTHDPAIVIYYLIVAISIGLLAALCYREHALQLSPAMVQQ